MGDINHKLDNKVYQKSKRYKEDLEKGLSAEIECKGRLESVFGELESSGRYCFYDFSNEKYLIELKSRNCNHNDYETAMINYTKILKWKKQFGEKEFISAFLYKDGLYYWKYNNDEITEIGTTGRTDRGCVESYEMVYFSYKLLREIQ
tara:strand:+ start:195 stop:638 length:444 start_codon:yes stop_codon:yes gene_type:complete